MLDSKNELKLVSDITALWYEHNPLYAKFFNDALENFNYVAGNQLDAATIAKLDREARPHAYWNLLKPVVAYLSGLQRSTRKKLKLEPVTPDDLGYVDIMNSTMDYLFTQTDKDYELSRAFVDAIIGKIGWMNVYLDYCNDPDGQIKVQRYDPFRIRTDVSYQKIDLSDCKYLMDSSFYTEKEIQLIYALEDNDLYNEIETRALPYLQNYDQKKVYSWVDRLLSGLGSYSDRLKQAIGIGTNVKSLQTDLYDTTKGLFRVIDFYDRRITNKLVVFDPQTSDTTDISEYEKDTEMLDIIKQKYPQGIIKRNSYEIIYITSIVPAFNLVLQDKPLPYQNGMFPFVPVFCYDMHPDMLETKSVIDDLKVPQDEFNKRQNTLLDYLQRHVSGGWIAERSAVAGLEESFLSNEMASLKLVNDGKFDKIRRDQPPPIPAGLKIDAQGEQELIQTISSVGMNQRGMQESSSESGKLFQSRAEMGELMQTLIMDNLNRADINIGRLMITFIQKFMKTPKLIRVNQDMENPNWIMINQPTLYGIENDISKGKYDVVIDFSPYSRLDRQRKFIELMEYVKIIGQINPAYVDIVSLLKASDMPYKKEWISFIMQQQQQAQMQIQGQQNMEQQKMLMGAIQKNPALLQQIQQDPNLQNEIMQQVQGMTQ